MPIAISIALVAVLAATATTTTPASQRRAVVPDTPAGRRLGEVLELVNAGDRDRLAAYASSSFAPSMLQPDDSILDFLVAQHARSGGLDVRHVVQAGEQQVTVLVQSRARRDAWLRYVVAVEPAPPHRVTGIFTFAASPAMADVGAGEIPAAELPARLVAVVDRLARDAGFSGSVCLMRRGEVLVRRAWGESDREAHVLNSPETRFGIASVGKLFTAVAIAQLVDSGRVAYGDRASRYVPDWLPPGAEAVTLAQLLTHTGGFGDYLPGVVGDRAARTYDALSDYRRFTRESARPPGADSAFRYSNTGFLLLGAVIETLTGEPWDAWIRTHVLAPAGASHAAPKRTRHPDSMLAIGYHRGDDGTWSRMDTLQAGFGTPAGGGVATAADLARFATAWAGGRLVSPAVLARMTTPRVDMTGTGRRYGYGVMVAEGADGVRVYGHHGGFPGVGALVEVYEPDGYVLAVLANTTDGATPVGDAWRDLLLRGRGRSGH